MKRIFIIGAIVLILGLAWLLWPSGEGRRPGDARAIEALKSLPYATWTEVREEDALKNGVVLHDATRAFQGVNLYSSENEPGAFLLDMNGNLILELRDARPEPRTWKLVKALIPDRFAALAQDGSILEVDKRSAVSWEKNQDFHHDFYIDSAGGLHVIDRRIREVPELSRRKPVRDDHFVVFSAGGDLELEISSADLIVEHEELLEVANDQRRPPLDREVDVFHTNTISRIPRDVYGSSSGELLFQKGDLLICWRNLDTIAVIDPTRSAIRWHWGAGEIEWPHHPTLLDNGNILLFDNGSERGWSRVIEIEPESGDIVWEYVGTPRESFFSSSRGSAQRLPNGNTLITDSMAGRVLEVAPDGETVWEFFEPRTRKKWFRTERATIYRMTRLPRWPVIDEATEASDP